MYTKKLPFVGCGVAIVTPFHDDGSIDYSSFKRLIDFQIDSGTDAIIVLGTTGESSTLTDNERRAVIEFSSEYIAGRVPLIVGTGTNRTAYSVELTNFADQCGCDGVLVVSPYYNKSSDKGLLYHFYKIADTSDRPVILYNIPGRTGVNISSALCADLAKHPNIVAIKEASGNISHVADVISRCGDSLAVYSGNDDQTVPIMSLGGKGVISVAANIIPKIMRDLTHTALGDDFQSARTIQLKYGDLFNALFSEVNPIPVKCACEMMGLCGGALRLPLAELNSNLKDNLKIKLEKYGLI